MENKIITEDPREKMERLGVKALSDRELIMVLLGQGNASHSVDSISKDVLSLLDKGQEISLPSLVMIPGVGKAKASTILASLEIGRRKNNRKAKKILVPNDIYQEIRHYAVREQEQLIVMSLNGAHEVLNIRVATIGLINKTVVHPREVFAEPLKERATAIVMAHNHPSGSLEPSSEDKLTTDRIVKAGKILGISVIDHIIFSNEGYFSFLEHGVMY